jgi:hypothetical protein
VLMRRGWSGFIEERELGREVMEGRMFKVFSPHQPRETGSALVVVVVVDLRRAILSTYHPLNLHPSSFLV